jgi:predicted DsbA family dithiol-disulfide isomerase
MDKFEERQVLEETKKVQADPQYRSWILDEHSFDKVLCPDCDGKWPSLEQWREKVDTKISRIGKGFHPLKVDAKKSTEYKLSSNYFREYLEEVSGSQAV